MKNIKILLLLFLIINYSCSKKEIAFENLVNRNGLFYEVNADEPYSGIVFEKYENSQFKYKGEITDGEKDGEWVYFRKNGSKKEEINFKNNEMHGKSTYYAKNGDYTISYFKNGVLNDEQNKYDVNGKILSSFHFKDGKLDGKYLTYFKDEKERLVASYKDGKLNGKYLRLYENGKKREIANYMNGKLFGEKIEYWKNGNKKRIRLYEKNAVKSDKTYNEKGNIELDATYPGKIIFYENGKKKAEGLANKNKYIDIKTFKTYYGENIFDFNTLTNFIWTSPGKSRRQRSPTKGIYYLPSVRKRWFEKDMKYREADVAKRSYRPIYRDFNYEILQNKLPEFTIKIGESYKTKTIAIKNWNGKELKVIDNGQMLILKPENK